MDNDGDCDSCIFWERNHSGLGWCHRLPPKDNVSGHDDDRWGFVATTCSDWCGEFQPS
jgi:hypothetical protein